MRKKLGLLISEILQILEMREGIMTVTGNNWTKIIIPVFCKIPWFFFFLLLPDKIIHYLQFRLFSFCKKGNELSLLNISIFAFIIVILSLYLWSYFQCLTYSEQIGLIKQTKISKFGNVFKAKFEVI